MIADPKVDSPKGLELEILKLHVERTRVTYGYFQGTSYEGQGYAISCKARVSALEGLASGTYEARVKLPNVETMSLRAKLSASGSHGPTQSAFLASALRCRDIPVRCPGLGIGRSPCRRSPCSRTRERTAGRRQTNGPATQAWRLVWHHRHRSARSATRFSLGAARRKNTGTVEILVSEALPSVCMRCGAGHYILPQGFLPLIVARACIWPRTVCSARTTCSHHGVGHDEAVVP